MAEPDLTHAQLTAKLVVEGCLRIMEGKDPGAMPIGAVPLEPEEAKAAGVEPGGLAVFYPLGATGVLFYMRGAGARVWFNNEDCDGALETLEIALRNAYPKATFSQQVEHTVPDMNVRLYNVPIDDVYFASVEVTYPITRAARKQFIVRVHAQQRV
ncbi:MAG: hypothetical protein JNJ63_10345 [Hyphomonadaceae bacterium]|nr:hypothetical protein [Hyphomonadaceae bacterium]